MKTKIKKLVCCLLTFAMLFSLAACADSGTSDEASAETAETPEETTEETTEGTEPYYVAVASAFTGDSAIYGEQLYNGVKIAVDEVNANGGINGRQIVIDTFDDKNDTTEAANIAQRIASDEKYIAVFGSYSTGCVLAAAPIYAENRLVQFSPTASTRDIDEVGPYTWSMSPTVSMTYDLFSEVACNTLGGQRIALIHLNADNGYEIEEVMSEAVPALGGELVAIESFVSGQVRDFTSILHKVKESDPDVVCVCSGYADAASIVIQSDQVDLDAQFLLSTENYCQEFIDAVGDTDKEVYVASIFSAQALDENVQTFVQKYEEAYGSTPSQFASDPYAAACLFISAMEQGATDRESLYQVLSEMTECDVNIYSGEIINRRVQRDNVYVLKLEGSEWTAQN